MEEEEDADHRDGVQNIKEAPILAILGPILISMRFTIRSVICKGRVPVDGEKLRKEDGRENDREDLLEQRQLVPINIPQEPEIDYQTTAMNTPSHEHVPREASLRRSFIVLLVIEVSIVNLQLIFMTTKGTDNREITYTRIQNAAIHLIKQLRLLGLGIFALNYPQ